LDKVSLTRWGVVRNEGRENLTALGKGRRIPGGRGGGGGSPYELQNLKPNKIELSNALLSLRSYFGRVLLEMRDGCLPCARGKGFQPEKRRRDPKGAPNPFQGLRKPIFPAPGGLLSGRIYLLHKNSSKKSINFREVGPCLITPRGPDPWQATSGGLVRWGAPASRGSGGWLHLGHSDLPLRVSRCLMAKEDLGDRKLARIVLDNAGQAILNWPPAWEAKGEKIFLKQAGPTI